MLQGKKHATNFKSVDYVIVSYKKVKCDSDVINAVLECIKSIKDNY